MILPPVDKTMSFLLLLKYSGDSRFLVFLPDGSSYYLPPDEVKSYLKRLDYEDYESPVDYAWNFGGVFVSLENGTYEYVSRDDLLVAAKRLREEASVIESGVTA